VNRWMHKLLHRPISFLRGDMRRWYQSQGVEFLERIGIREGQVVVDFGCRVGHYSIPAGKAVGSRGCVYAVDKNRRALVTLTQSSARHGVRSVRTILNEGGTTIDLPDSSVDCVLLYDILHMMEKPVRVTLYRDVARVLRSGALLSVHAAHSKDFIPNKHFAGMTIDDVQHEIQESGLLYKTTVWDRITHDNGLVESGVMNFRKKATVKEEIQ
jgi:ubiquinone/menaquinone biosynthesis C-methylase UbiE